MIQKKKNKLLHFCSYTWESGGPPNVIYNHASYQLKNDWIPVVASTLATGQHPYKPLSGLDVIHFKPHWLAKFIPDFSFEMLFWYVKHRHEFAVIQSHGLWNFATILPYLIPNKSFKVISIHGFMDEYVLNHLKYKKLFYWYLFQKFTFWKADMLHAISKDEEIYLKTRFPQYASKIKYIPNGIEVPELIPTENVDFKGKIDSFLEGTEQCLLFLGRITQKKGLDLLLPAFNSLLNSYPNAKLIIAGPVDGYESEFSELVSLYGSSHLLILPTTIDWPKSYLLKKADVFVLPSYSEGFSIAALEALAYQKACVFSEKIGFAADVKEYEAGIICALNVESIQNCLTQILENATLKKQLQGNAKKLFDDKFTNERVGKLFLDSLQASMKS